MTPEEIKTLMKIRRIRQRDLVKRWKLPSCTVSALVNRKFKSDKLEKRLAKTIGVTLNQLRGEGRAA